LKTLHATITAAFGRQYLARLDDGRELACVPRGKKSEVVCGDEVEIALTAEDQGVIERIAPRRSLLHRSDVFREKLIAANVTQIVVVLATEPSFSDELLARCLVAAQDQRLQVIIVLNKCDLQEQVEAARERLLPYRAIGYRIVELSAKQNSDTLRPLLHGHLSVLVGQSGMGKSTLINSLIPGAQAATREISAVLDSGKHTTTHARLYRLDADSSLIDCPGVQAFGLHHLSFGEIESGFVEFAAYLGQCRFHNCHHLHEPGCAIRQAVEDGAVHPRRLALFQQITAGKA
jgi:ribosome biogenesis GTPase